MDTVSRHAQNDAVGLCPNTTEAAHATSQPAPVSRAVPTLRSLYGGDERNLL
jgi:hypothetical protein